VKALDKEIREKEESRQQAESERAIAQLQKVGC